MDGISLRYPGSLLLSACQCWGEKTSRWMKKLDVRNRLWQADWQPAWPSSQVGRKMCCKFGREIAKLKTKFRALVADNLNPKGILGRDFWRRSSFGQKSRGSEEICRKLEKCGLCCIFVISLKPDLVLSEKNLIKVLKQSNKSNINTEPWVLEIPLILRPVLSHFSGIFICVTKFLVTNGTHPPQKIVPCLGINDISFKLKAKIFCFLPAEAKL